MHACLRNLLLPVLAFSVVAAGNAAEPAKSGDDPIRAVLIESKEKQRGVAIHVGGQTINAVVTAVEAQHVIGRSQTTSRIVIRLDRIDGVSAMF